MYNVVIRAMKAADALPISALVSADYHLLAERDCFTVGQLQRLLAERSTEGYLRESWLTRWDCFVAEAEARLLGAVAIDGNEIEELWVDPECHHQGIGSALFRYAEQRMRETGHHLLTLSCATQSARPFYVAMGCTIASTRLCAGGPLEGRFVTRYQKSLR